MKLPDPEQFTYKDCVIAGDECWLINPNDIKCKWTDDILHFRSLIIRKSDHMVISSGYKKFFNLLEKPDVDAFPKGPFKAISKMDGSLLICSWTVGKNGQEEYIFRTRGTSTIETLDNGHELEFLLEKYPKLKVAMKLNPLHSILCEWETPNNPIVLRRVTEPTLTLVGGICHNDFKYVPQDELDKLAIVWGLERPETHHYDSIEDCVEDVKYWKGKEGVVLYSEDGQHLRKVKADEYLKLHKLFSGYKNINNYLDLFMETERYTKYSDFYSYIEKNLDYEIAEGGKDYICDICTAYTKFLIKLDHLKKVVDDNRSFTRKEQALEFQRHWNDWRVAGAFQLLDKHEVDDKVIRKGIEKELGL